MIEAPELERISNQYFRNMTRLTELLPAFGSVCCLPVTLEAGQARSPNKVACDMLHVSI